MDKDETNDQNAEQDFSDAFAEASVDKGIEEPPIADKPATPEPPIADKPATAEPATAEPATAEPATAESATAESATAEPTVVDKSPATEPTPNLEEITQKAADAAAKKLADEAATKQKADEAATKQKADEAAAKDAEKPNDTEQAILNDVTENFPEVAKALPVIERVIMAKIENILESKVGKLLESLNTQLAPMINATQKVAGNQHEAAILTSHSDAFDILPNVEEWINKQPSFLKSAYSNVLDRGSSAEVVELLTLYKDQATPNQNVQNQTKKEKLKKMEEKLQSQEGLKSRRSTSGGIDLEDFSSAFKRYAK